MATGTAMRTALQQWVTGRLPKSRMVRNIGVLAGGTVFSQGLLIVVSPLLTRLYTPEDFGMLAVYISMLSLLLVVASWLYEQAIPLPAAEEDALHLLLLSLLLVGGTAMLTALGVWWFGDEMAAWGQVPALQPYLWLLPLSLLGAGAYQALNQWAVRREAFRLVTKTRLQQSVGAVTTQVGLGLLSGPLGLLVGDAVSRMLGSSSLLRAAWREVRGCWEKVSWRGIRQMVKRYRRFPLLSTWPTLLNGWLLQIPLLLLTSVHGAQVVGLYALAQRVLGLPIGVIGGAVSQVYMAEAARRVQREPERMPQLFWGTVKHLALIGLPLLLVLAVAAPWCFGWVFGEEWRESGEYVRLMSLLFYLQFLSIPIGNNLVVYERQDLHLLREGVRIVLMGGTVLVVVLGELSSVAAVALLSGTGSLGYLLHGYLSWWAMKQGGTGMRGDVMVLSPLQDAQATRAPEWERSLEASEAEQVDEPSNPLLLAGWQEFNRLKWGVTPQRVFLQGEKGDRPQLEAIVYRNRRGKIVRPPLNPYLALRFLSTDTTHPFKLTSQWVKLTDSLAARMRAFGLGSALFLSPEVADVRPWQWRGFLTSVRYTYHLDFPYDVQTADTGVRNRVKKARKLGLTCRRAHSVQEIYECLKATEDRQGFDHRLTPDDLELARRCLGDEHLRGYVCLTEDGEPASAAYVLHVPGSTAIGWVAGAKGEHLSSGAVQLLDLFILEDLQANGASGFDFVGANLPGVATAKSYWGGRLLPYYVIEQPGWRTLLRVMRQWVRRLFRRHV
ncbi:MAG TPA: GNAT family N-acetyltransferase [Bacilli bacterium]|nr:GNAT family N-acetyltransferase [Bacilli bacterium]